MAARQPGEAARASEPGGPVQLYRARVPTAAAMRALGSRLATVLHAGDLVVLSGPLGAGKTTLVQGIGAGLGVRGAITSPTFVIARVHPPQGAGPALVHADAYRLGGRAEVDDLDLDTDTDRAVTVVEWGEGLVEQLAPGYLEVRIAMPADGAELSPGGGDWDTDQPRDVDITGHGKRWHAAAESARLAFSGGPGAL
jgi:tRNA threonylcarbamoyladenosine biosynthesis protein TsaE